MLEVKGSCLGWLLRILAAQFILFLGLNSIVQTPTLVNNLRDLAQEKGYDLVEGRVIDYDRKTVTICNANGKTCLDYKMCSVTYEYLVGGKKYSASKFSLGTAEVRDGRSYYFCSNMEASPYSTIGSDIAVYYNPTAPAQATLRRGLTSGMILGLLIYCVSLTLSVKIIISIYKFLNISKK